MKESLSFFLAFSLVSLVFPDIPRPRGVATSKAAFYVTGADFTCLDGSATISFDKINDDYCDCKDGSDEPGTSACPTGSFHCTNAGHKPMYIPSSRVNDGICDCCDGTDEYDSDSPCENTCREMGKAAREEAERRKQLEEEGHVVFKEYSEIGQQAKLDKQARKEELEKEKAALEEEKNTLENLKNEAETPEKEAKEKHKAAWEELKEQRKNEKEETISKEAFKTLDINADQFISVDEMQQRPEFDIDNNEEVSPEEAKEYLEDQEQVDYETFKNQVWPNIKEIYVPPPPPEKEEENIPGVVPHPDDVPPEEREPLDQGENLPLDDEDLDEYHGEDDDADDDYMDDDYADHDDDDDDDHDEKGDEADEEMPPYDSDTQVLIDEAETAREKFKEAETKFRDAESELNNLNTILGLDLGENMEYYPLKGNCYEYTDREYTYKLCPFEKASQRSKSGGSETSLGTWGRWDGPEHNLYSAQKYERGQNCWNGPDRSVRVLIECGINNEVYSASEPNRCEYQFNFRTPAACSNPPSPEQKDADHDEL